MNAPDGIDAGRAWELLLGLARAPEILPETGLVVAPDGTWSSRRPVDREAATLFDLYLSFALANASNPSTIGHLGQSLDGRIATADGGSHYVTGPENIVHLHRMRALCGAVLVGIGTVEADDPRLTARHVPGPDPLRVVIDPGGRLTPGRRLLDSGANEALVVIAGDAPAPAGIEALRLPAGEAGIAPAVIVAALHARGLHRIFVEGGGATVSRFLAAGALDRLQVTVAPVLIGGGRPGLTLPAIADLSEAPRPPARHFAMGRDVLFDCDLRAPPEGPDGRP